MNSSANTERSPTAPTFIHSGDAGDVIYALPVIRHLAPEGANLLLGNKAKVRKPFDPEWAASLMSLLRLQPYLSSVRLAAPGDRWNHDMDRFREHVFRRHVHGKNLTQYTCDVFKVPYSCSDHAWLSIDYPMTVDDRPVLVSRSMRYRNPAFPWKRVYDTYADKMVFVGLPDEWANFQSTIGQIPYCRTETILDLARMIGGCLLFIGNQSLPYAIAEGLKQNTVLESWPRVPDCIFGRENATIGSNERVILPDLRKLS